MSWVELRLHIPQQVLEDVSSYLFALGCEGINVRENDVQVYFNKRHWTPETRNAVIGYIGHFIPEFSRRDIKIVAIADKDWLDDWKSFFKPLHVTGRVIIRPPWEPAAENSDEIEVVIDPKMAFGTGHHESTQLAIEFMDQLIRPGMNVLDVGCGSGILSILAVKLGATFVVGIDTDPPACKNALENTLLNGTADRTQFFCTALSRLQPFDYDVVVANINRNALLDLAQDFSQYLHPQGKLILSGLLSSDEAMVVKRYEGQGFSVIDKKTRKEWLSLVFRHTEEDTNDSGGN